MLQVHQYARLSEVLQSLRTTFRARGKNRFQKVRPWIDMIPRADKTTADIGAEKKRII